MGSWWNAAVGDSKKAVLEGAAAIGAAALALVSGPVGVVAAALPTLVSLGFDAIKASDQRRAARLIKGMLEADESPAEFAAQLDEKLRRDEDAISAFRILVSSSIESVAIAAIEPIALIGRRYLRGECPGWVARGWLRILVDLTGNEIEQLRALVHAADDLHQDWTAAYDQIAGTSGLPAFRAPVRMRIGPDSCGVRILTPMVPGDFIQRADLQLIAAGAERAPAPTSVANDYAERLFAELERLHLARRDETSSQREQQRRQIEREKKRDHALAVGEMPKLRLEPVTDYGIELVFEDMSFDVILEAMPMAKT